jgi:hypothetical protein
MNIQISNDEFDRRLDEKLSELTAKQLLELIPNIYEEISEYFNNEIIDEWEEEKEKKGNKEFQIYDYDVWGNANDGYEVNDIFRTSFIVELNKEDNDETIIKKLKEAGYINNDVSNKDFEIEGEFKYNLNINYIKDCFMPFCELRSNND